jgi:hypothetical protein
VGGGWAYLGFSTSSTNFLALASKSVFVLSGSGAFAFLGVESIQPIGGFFFAIGVAPMWPRESPLPASVGRLVIIRRLLIVVAHVACGGDRLN